MTRSRKDLNNKKTKTKRDKAKINKKNMTCEHIIGAMERIGDFIAKISNSDPTICKKKKKKKKNGLKKIIKEYLLKKIKKKKKKKKKNKKKIKKKKIKQKKKIGEMEKIRNFIKKKNNFYTKNYKKKKKKNSVGLIRILEDYLLEINQIKDLCGETPLL